MSIEELIFKPQVRKISNYFFMWHNVNLYPYGWCAGAGAGAGAGAKPKAGGGLLNTNLPRSLLPWYKIKSFKYTKGIKSLKPAKAQKRCENAMLNKI